MSMINGIKNKEGGFLELIVLIVIALFLMNYFHITLSDILGWFRMVIQNFLQFLR